VKRLWSAAALLLVLLGGALWNAWYADRLTGRMAGQLEQANCLLGHPHCLTGPVIPGTGRGRPGSAGRASAFGRPMTPISM